MKNRVLPSASALPKWLHQNALDQVEAMGLTIHPDLPHGWPQNLRAPKLGPSSIAFLEALLESLSQSGTTSSQTGTVMYGMLASQVAAENATPSCLHHGYLIYSIASYQLQDIIYPFSEIDTV